MRRWRFARLLIAVTIAAFATVEPMHAYLKLGVRVNGRDVELRWSRTPVRYAVTDRGVPGVSATDFQAAVARAFATWANEPSSTITYQFLGYTNALPGQDDGFSTLGFFAEPDLDRVLAATSFLVDTVTGEILESDIFFNTIFSWSVSSGGTAGRYDLESIALHEIGHLSGLGHSAIGETELASAGRRVLAAEAVMFPIAFSSGNVSGRTLRPDDVAGIADLYPAADVADETGSLSGRVTKSGAGLLGAHIVAFHLESGQMIGNFSLDKQGAYVIAGLSPGPYIVRAEPLDDADVDSFFDPPIDTSFQPMFLNRIVVVPRGGDSSGVDLAVQPR
jgi:hypothetical protein